MRRKYLYSISILVATLLSLAALSSCEEEDDLAEIFNGNSFKITGITYNGKKVVSGVTELYAAPGTYWITFNMQTFQGMLNATSPIEGTYSADGKTHAFTTSLTAGSSPKEASELCREIFTIIRDAQAYKGDHNILRIIKDRDTYIELSSTSTIK